MLTGSALDAVLADPRVATRYWSKVYVVPGSECLWWGHAVSGRGHGRFWLGPGEVMIAHRVAWAYAYGADSLEEAPLLGHETCDNTLCQNVEHLLPMSAWKNSHDWAERRHRVHWPLSDVRGALGRAVAIRDALRAGRDPMAVAAAGDVARDQLELF